MKTVFLDVDTQIDFLYPAGALYVPGAETIVPAIARLNSYAVEHGHTLLSTADAHTENDPEFTYYPAHCIKGTVGQHKPAVTLVGQRIIEKRTTNCFHHTALSSTLEGIAAERYVVYGVVTEICVRHAVFGLLDRGGRVELVTDAVRSLDKAQADKMIEEFTARGGILTTVAEVAV